MGGKLVETACCSEAPTATKFLDRLAARNAGYNLTIRQVRWSLDGSGSAPGIRSWARAYGVGSLNGRRIGHELHLSRRSVTVLQCRWSARTGIGGASPGKATGTRALETAWITLRYIELCKISSVKPTEKISKLSIRPLERFVSSNDEEQSCKHNKTMLGMVDLRKPSRVASESLLK